LLGANAKPDEAMMREAGINSYVAKPVGQRELFDALTVALAHDAIPLARSAMLQRPQSRELPPDVPAEKRGAVRILLAEDNFLNRMLTISQLEKLGHAADAFAIGNEPIESIACSPSELVLTDCELHIVDGYEATTKVRKQKK